MERIFQGRVDEVKRGAHGRWPGILAAYGIPAGSAREPPWALSDVRGQGSFPVRRPARERRVLLQRLRRGRRLQAARALPRLGLRDRASPRRRERGPAAKGRAGAAKPPCAEGAPAGAAAADLGPGNAGRGGRRGGTSISRGAGSSWRRFRECCGRMPRSGTSRRRASGTKRLATYPAMLAKVQAVDRRPVTLHRTYLAGGTKAAVPGVKKLFSAGVKGAAIRLFEPESELALAEGIETALAVHLRTGLPVWAAGNAGSLEVVELPETVTRWRSSRTATRTIAGRRPRMRCSPAREPARRRSSVAVYVPRRPGDGLPGRVLRRRKLAA